MNVIDKAKDFLDKGFIITIFRMQFGFGKKFKKKDEREIKEEANVNTEKAIQELSKKLGNTSKDS